MVKRAAPDSTCINTLFMFLDMCHLSKANIETGRRGGVGPMHLRWVYFFTFSQILTSGCQHGKPMRY